MRLNAQRPDSQLADAGPCEVQPLQPTVVSVRGELNEPVVADRDALEVHVDECR